MTLIGAGKLDRFPSEDVRLRRGLGKSTFVPFIGATQSVDLGSFSLTTTGVLAAGQLVSSMAMGTAPITVVSTTLVTNLNADLLDGLHASAFVTSVTGTAPIASSGGTTPAISVADAATGSKGVIPASGTPATNQFLRADITTGAIGWNQIAYTDISGAPGGTVTSVTGTAPIASSGGTTPAISLTLNGLPALQIAGGLGVLYAGNGGNSGLDCDVGGLKVKAASPLGLTGSGVCINYGTGLTVAIGQLVVDRATTDPWYMAAGSGVTAVSGTAPVVSSEGTTPAISITDVDATHKGAVPLSGTPATNQYLKSTITSGVVAWDQIAYTDVSGTPAAISATAPIVDTAGVISITDVDATHKGAVPLSGTPATNQFLRADITTGVVGWNQIDYADITGTAPGGVTSVSGTAPVVSSGGTTPAISITDVDATHKGAVPLSGTPGTNQYLKSAITTGAVSWGQIAYADLSGAPAYVPYTGATGDVDLGVYRLTAGSLFASADGIVAGTTTLVSIANRTLRVTDNITATSIGVDVILWPTVVSGKTPTGNVRGLASTVLRGVDTGAANDDGTLAQITGMASAYGHYSAIATVGTTVTVVGLNLQGYATKGTITSMYDMYIGPLVTGGTVTNRWSIYQADTTTRNYFGSKVGIGANNPTSPLQVVGLPVYANNAAAVAGGLTAGAFYRTNANPDPVCVVH